MPARLKGERRFHAEAAAEGRGESTQLLDWPVAQQGRRWRPAGDEASTASLRGHVAHRSVSQIPRAVVRTRRLTQRAAKLPALRITVFTRDS